MRDSVRSTGGVLAHPCGDGESQIAAGREDIERLLGHIVSELRALRQQRLAIETRIATIKRTCKGLQQLFGVGVSDLIGQFEQGIKPRNRGLTSLCRAIFTARNGSGLTLFDILGHIQESRPELLGKYRSPKSVLTMVLARLETYGEVERITEAGVIKWKSGRTN